MNPENDLLFLREAVKDLNEYILARDLFWPLQSKTRTADGGKLAQLTLGNLVLSQARLAASRLPVELANEYAQIAERIDQVRDEWQSNWRIKEEQEIGSRLKQWQEYLRDLRGDPRQHGPFYAREVRTRVILDLLRPEAQEKKEHAEQLHLLDQVLRGVSQPGPFVWDADIAAGFPPERFWYLYRSIVSG